MIRQSKGIVAHSWIQLPVNDRSRDHAFCETVLWLTLTAAPSRMFEAWRVAVWVVPAWGKTLIC
jgi:hypothetical protein